MFNENVIGTVLIVLIVAIPIVIACLGPVISHKSIKLRDITPILVDACKEFVSLKAESTSNFEQFEADVISMLVADVKNISSLTADEKALVTPEIAKILLHRHLQAVFNAQQPAPAPEQAK
jgi:hypothetical protein